jgi:hypothetical protein
MRFKVVVYAYMSPVFYTDDDDDDDEAEMEVR